MFVQPIHAQMGNPECRIFVWKRGELIHPELWRQLEAKGYRGILVDDLRPYRSETVVGQFSTGEQVQNYKGVKAEIQGSVLAGMAKTIGRKGDLCGGGAALINRDGIETRADEVAPCSSNPRFSIQKLIAELINNLKPCEPKVSIRLGPRYSADTSTVLR